MHEYGGLTLFGIGISAIGSGWAVIGEATHDATLLAWAGTFTAVVLPLLISTYKKAMAARAEVDASEFAEYKKLLMNDLKELRNNNAELLVEVAKLKAQIQGK